MGEVLVNHMYSGDYLENGNLGHEVINLFKCDNGNHYIYAMSAGDYDTKSHYKNIKKVILVRNVDQYKAEILGIADVEEDIFASQVLEPQKYTMLPSVQELVENDFMNQKNPDGSDKDVRTLARIDTYKSVHLAQKKYIDENDIKYGGVKPYDLFAGNNTNKSGHSIYLTFKVINFRKPRDLIYLCDNRVESSDSHYFILQNKKRMCGASIATFEDVNDKELQRLFSCEYWESEDTSSTVDINSISVKSTSLLNVIRKNNDEITYSNWISYYLKNDKALLMNFINHFSGKQTSFDNIEIYRETKDNIDLYYEDTKSIFIFENKIKSSINGTKKKNGITEEEEQFSQLEKYYNFVEAESRKFTPKKQTAYFILLPNYAYKDISKLEKYAKFTEYKIIRYKELHDFFEANTTNLPYYSDFVKALEYHSMEYINDLYSEMLERLLSAISLKK